MVKELGFGSWQKQTISLNSTGSGSHLVFYTMGTGGSLHVKRLQRKADHSPSHSAEVKNGGITTTITFTPPWCSA
jgi:hypothetical protein